MDVKGRDACSDPDAPADEETVADHCPDGFGDGLTDGAADEEDVGYGHDGATAHDVGEDASDKTAEEGTEGGGRGDEFLEEGRWSDEVLSRLVTKICSEGRLD